jgi:hypothetical protein
MLRVAMTVVNKILVTSVRDGGVAAVSSMRMRVSGMFGMRSVVALVPVRIVLVMAVALVHVVVMARVRNTRMSTVRAVLMRVLVVFLVRHVHEPFLLSAACRTASSAIRAMCASVNV